MKPSNVSAQSQLSSRGAPSHASKPSIGGAVGQGLAPLFKPQGPVPLRKLPGVKTFPQGQVPPEPFLPLEKVIGLSSRGTTSIAINPVTGDVAYPAGAIICIYNPKENKQTRFLYSQALQRSYSCLAFSGDGRYLAAGEGAFRQPEITIWEIDQNTGEYIESKHLRGHKYGIQSVMFSPNMLYLISLGDANDRGLFVWDWRTEQRVTSNKLGKPVNNFAFATTSAFFVTAGYQHLKYWCFDESGKVKVAGPNAAQGNGQAAENIMESKSADLTKVKVKIFVGVQCTPHTNSQGKEEQLVLALATDGHLYVYSQNRTLMKWMNIKVERALSCVIGGQFLYCGCTEGTVRIFNTKTLEHILTLPKPPPLGQANQESGKKIRIPSSKDSKFADALAVLVDEKNQRVLVLYSDKMIFIWDVKALDKISVFRTLYSHCGPIYDMQYVPNSVKAGFQHLEDATPLLNDEEMQYVTKFATCSSDRTVRFWTFIDPASTTSQSNLSKMLVRNAYSKDMSRMIYVNSESRDEFGNLVAQSAQQTTFNQFKVSCITLNEDGTPKPEVEPHQQQRDIDQLRCIRISPDGNHLAVGDWSGNIRIHDLQNTQNVTFEEIQCIQAHDSEVVCLDYSPSQQIDESNYKYWLASGSRDRLTQIYEFNTLKDSANPYHDVAILDDHSSTITSVRFAEEKNSQNQRRLKLFSSGADKQVVVRTVNPQADHSSSEFQTQLTRKEQCKSKVFSMDIAGGSSGYAVTGHDKYMQLWQTSSGLDKVWDRKVDSQKKQAVLDLLRVTFGAGPGHQFESGGPLCEIVITSSADKSVTIYETATGNAVCRTTCGEVTLSMCLSTNLKHLITTSMDGIIYIWKLPESLTKALLKFRAEPPQGKKPITANPEKIIHNPQQQLQYQPQAEKERSHSANNNNKSDEFDFKNIENNYDEQQQIKQRAVSNVTENENPLNPTDQSSIMLDDSHYQEGQPTPSISMIMQQISKVATQIDKIQPLRGRGGPTIPPEEPFSPSGCGASEQETVSAQQASRRRNPWGASNRSPRAENNNLMDTAEIISPSQNKEGDDNVRPLQVKENKLPRWAQSVTGDSAFALQGIKKSVLPPPQEKNEPIEEDIEDIFSNTLDKVAEQQPSGVNQAVFYGNIQEEEQSEEPSSNLGQEEEERKSGNQMGASSAGFDEGEDPDELMIREQLRLRNIQHKQILGLDDDEEDNLEGDQSAVSRSSRMLLRRQSENRQSQSQLFLKRKQQQQQTQQESKQLKVEDIFDESQTHVVEPAKPQHPDIQLVGKPPKESRYAQREPIILDATLEDFKKSSEKQQRKNILDEISTIQQVDSSSHRVDEESVVMSESVDKFTEQQPTMVVEQQQSFIQQELDKINESLQRIQSALSSTQRSMSGESQMSESLNESFQKSFDLWTNISQTLQLLPSQQNTTLPQSAQSSHINFNLQPQRSGLSVAGNNSDMQNISSYAPSQAGISMLSQISIKDDAMDLLQRYSEMLFAEVRKKMQDKS